MELNGERWFVPITDTSVESAASKREKASGPGSVGAGAAVCRHKC